MKPDSTGQPHQQHDSEIMLRAILETAVDPIITIDRRGIVQSCNPATEQMLWYTAEELIGQNVGMIMPGEIRREHDDYIARYLQTGEKRIIGIGREVWARRKDGFLIPVDLAVSEVRLHGERYFTGILRDLTARRRAEEQALQAERLAAIGQVVTTISHESRNLLQRIQMGVEMLQYQLGENVEAQQEVSSIEQANDGLRKLLEEIRTFAAPLRLEESQFDLAQAWQEAWQDSLRNHDKYTPDTNCEAATLAPAPCDLDLTCQGDLSRMVQVFRNLFENSLAAGGAEPHVEIRCEPAELNGRRATRIVLQDNGPGLDAEQRERIFEPFYTTKSKGTGLGMSIARRIVEAHGGTLELAPNGQPSGACFVITLPSAARA